MVSAADTLTPMLLFGSFLLQLLTYVKKRYKNSTAVRRAVLVCRSEIQWRPPVPPPPPYMRSTRPTRFPTTSTRHPPPPPPPTPTRTE